MACLLATKRLPGIHKHECRGGERLERSKCYGLFVVFLLCLPGLVIDHALDILRMLLDEGIDCVSTLLGDRTGGDGFLQGVFDRCGDVALQLAIRDVFRAGDIMQALASFELCG